VKEPRVLVAGVGNIFLGDDGFGVEVVRRLGGQALPRGVEVRDFGTRGFDLSLALMKNYDQVVLVDAVKRGGRPGTLYVLEVDPSADDRTADFDIHGMAPRQVFRAVRAMGGELRKLRVLACEPEDFGEPELGRLGLSASVEAAVPEALKMLEDLVHA
jgi:hydrogenase maturation protease